jgi:hypothetical protein
MGQRGQNTSGAQLEEGEKNGRFTRRTSACSGKPKQDLSCRIPPVFMEEKEDAPVCVVEPGSIPSAESDGGLLNLDGSGKKEALAAEEKEGRGTR